MKFWYNRKVLVTGHTGFKGSWLCLWLQSLGAKVIGLSLEPSSEPSLFSSANVAHGMISIIGDIRDYATVYQVLTQQEPEIIIHLAAQSLVRTSYKAPVDTYATNVMGSLHILEAARQVGSVRTIVNITTDKCYENKEWYWGYRENDRLGGFDPYSNSKACAELVSAAYRDSFFNNEGIGLATARAGNVIGGGDWSTDRLIPDIIRACIERKPVSIRNPSAVRPWQHVLEPLYGYLLLAEKLHSAPAQFSEAWNFGPDDNDSRPVGWITDYIVKHWQGAEQWQKDNGHNPHEAHLLHLDCAKAKNKLGWQPRWNLKKGLDETIHWYKAFFNKQNMRKKTTEQIEHFLEADCLAIAQD